MILISFVSFANADSEPVILKHGSSDGNIVQQNHLQTKHFTVSLTESMSLQSDNTPGQRSQNDQIQESSSNHKNISLSDNLKIETNDQEEQILVMVHESSERITSLDKIASVDRIRITGKGITVENIQSSKQVEAVRPVVTLDKTYSHNFLQNNNILNDLTGEIKTPLLGSINAIQSVASEDIFMLTGDVEQFGNNVEQYVHVVSLSNNPVLLVVLIPISGYILIRAENEKLRIKNSRQFLSSFFIVILLSSAIITPFSVSGNYWWMAFADSNSTENDSNLSIPENSTNTNTVNSTQPTLVFSDSNSTQLGPIFSDSNSTQLGPIFSDSNSTQPGQIPSNSNNSGTVIPNATESFDFTSSDTKTDKVRIANNTNN